LKIETRQKETVSPQKEEELLQATTSHISPHSTIDLQALEIGT
jgi:hypothetical protein